MERRNLGRPLALAGGGAFPGFARLEGDRRGALWSGALAALLHASLLAALIAYTWAHPAIEPEIVPVQILKEPPPKPVAKAEPVPKPAEAPPTPAPKPTPAPPKPAPKPTEAAPAPKVLAERSSPTFSPQAQAVAPQVINPSVVAKAAPTVAAEKLQMNAVGQVAAPKEIGKAAIVTDRVSAVSSVAAAQVSKVDVGGAAAPALRGPIEPGAPAGASAGPRQVTTVGAGAGTAAAATAGTGSSVKEGIASNRDVLGSPTGAPLASVNTRVGEGFQRGDGGTGTGEGGGGGGGGDCFARPEVRRYLDDVRSRTLARWALPSGVAANQQVTLRFTLDAAGSPQSVDVVSAPDRALGSSAVDALRSAAPFPPLPDPARCLTRQPITATFRNPLAG